MRVNGGQRQAWGGQWESRMLGVVVGQLEPLAFSSTWNMEMIIFKGC